LTSQDSLRQRASGLSTSVQTRSEGTRQQLAVLLPGFEPKLLELALRLCGNATDARDLVQDTFERALRSAEVPPTEPRVRAWLYTILQNLFLDRCRSLRVKALHEGPLEPSVEETCAAPEQAPEPVWESITHQQLHAALGGMKEEFRRVYELHELEGHSYEDIARRMGIARATVGTRLVRARQRLRVLLSSVLGGATEVSRD